MQSSDEKTRSEAKEQIVKENTGLVWSVVKRFANRGYEAEDLFQIGSIGLLKCIAKFDLSYKVKFSTYAVPMIIGEIKRFLRDDGMIKVSRPIKETAAKARYMQDAMTKREGRTPTMSELAEAIGVNVEALVVALEASMDVESLYTPVTQPDGSELYLIDKLSENGDEEHSLVDNIALKQLIGKLKPKERQIIMLRYFQDKTQTEIAKEIGVSQVQVSRIEKKVLQSMRDNFDH
jgi:RNA polymerase sporulation-specific sigma factor